MIVIVIGADSKNRLLRRPPVGAIMAFR